MFPRLTWRRLISERDAAPSHAYLPLGASAMAPKKQSRECPPGDASSIVQRHLSLAYPPVEASAIAPQHRARAIPPGDSYAIASLRPPPCVPSHRRICDRAAKDGSCAPNSRRFCGRSASVGSCAPSLRRLCDLAAAAGLRPGAWRTIWSRDAAFFRAYQIPGASPIDPPLTGAPRRWVLLCDFVSGANLSVSRKSPIGARFCFPCNARPLGPD